MRTLYMLAVWLYRKWRPPTETENAPPAASQTPPARDSGVVDTTEETTPKDRPPPAVAKLVYQRPAVTPVGNVRELLAQDIGSIPPELRDPAFPGVRP